MSTSAGVLVHLAPDRPVWHDLCSAVHPLALASPFFGDFDLGRRGVRLVAPAVSYGQVLDDGRAVVAYRDLERTAEALGVRKLPDALLGTSRRLRPYATCRDDVSCCSAVIPPGPG